MKPKRNRQQLHDALVHVRYTMTQVIATTYWELMESRLSYNMRPLTTEVESILANACIDSSLCSLRILDQFFGEPNKDYITASEYGFQELDLLGSRNRAQINNHVSHLTHKRAEEPPLEFSNRLILSAFPVCTEFLEHLIASFLRPEDREMMPVSQELAAFRQARKRFKI